MTSPLPGSQRVRITLAASLVTSAFWFFMFSGLGFVLGIPFPDLIRGPGLIAGGVALSILLVGVPLIRLFRHVGWKDPWLTLGAGALVGGALPIAMICLMNLAVGEGLFPEYPHEWILLGAVAGMGGVMGLLSALPYYWAWRVQEQRVRLKQVDEAASCDAQGQT